ncbi:hypothetical protein SNEBB_004341 [Seison nebaliae]|nr:hypothetical protein SNEBB_004341 [Seison nebaliae]
MPIEIPLSDIRQILDPILDGDVENIAKKNYSDSSLEKEINNFGLHSKGTFYAYPKNDQHNNQFRNILGQIRETSYTSPIYHWWIAKGLLGMCVIKIIFFFLIIATTTNFSQIKSWNTEIPARDAFRGWVLTVELRFRLIKYVWRRIRPPPSIETIKNFETNYYSTHYGSNYYGTLDYEDSLKKRKISYTTGNMFEMNCVYKKFQTMNASQNIAGDTMRNLAGEKVSYFSNMFPGLSHPMTDLDALKSSPPLHFATMKEFDSCRYQAAYIVFLKALVIILVIAYIIVLILLLIFTIMSGRFWLLLPLKFLLGLLLFTIVILYTFVGVYTIYLNVEEEQHINFQKYLCNTIASISMLYYPTDVRNDACSFIDYHNFLKKDVFVQQNVENTWNPSGKLRLASHSEDFKNIFQPSSLLTGRKGFDDFYDEVQDRYKNRNSSDISYRLQTIYPSCPMLEVVNNVDESIRNSSSTEGRSSIFRSTHTNDDHQERNPYRDNPHLRALFTKLGDSILIIFLILISEHFSLVYLFFEYLRISHLRARYEMSELVLDFLLLAKTKYNTTSMKKIASAYLNRSKQSNQTEKRTDRVSKSTSRGLFQKQQSFRGSDGMSLLENQRKF